MKKIILLFLLAFSSVVFAQNLPVDASTNKVTFMEALDAGTLKQAQLKQILTDFAKKKGMVSISDEGEKVKYSFSIKVAHQNPDNKVENGTVKFTVFFGFKDGKYRFILSDFEHVGDGKNPSGGPLEAESPGCGKIKMSGRGWVTIKNKTKSDIDALIAEIKQTVLEVQNNPENADNW